MNWDNLDKYAKEDVKWGIDEDFANYVKDRFGDASLLAMCNLLMSSVKFVDGIPQLQLKSLPAYMREWIIANRNNDDYCGYFNK